MNATNIRDLLNNVVTIAPTFQRVEGAIMRDYSTLAVLHPYDVIFSRTVFIDCDFTGLSRAHFDQLAFKNCEFRRCVFDLIAFNSLAGLQWCYFVQSGVTIAKGNVTHGAILGAIFDGVIRIRGGCRRMTGSDARRHWKRARGRKQARISLEYLIATLQSDGGKLR